MEMVVAGCDPHLDTVTVALADPRVPTLTVANSGHGWGTVTDWCRQNQVRLVGIEGASGYGHALARTLTKAGIEVREVPTRLTARTRRVDGAGKTDPGDARTIARVVAQGEGHQWSDDPQLETLRLLTNRRDHLVGTQTTEINQLRALLTEVDPEKAALLPRLRSRRQFRSLTGLDYRGDPHQETVGRLVREIASGCIDRLEQIRRLESEIEQVLPPAGKALIDQIQGCGVIVAAQLLSQLAGSGGFGTDAKMAAWAGTAPLDASSGRQQRHRFNRGGNRQANRAIHTIIISQLQHRGEAHDYLTRRLAEGKTPKEAIRAAKRHLTRRIWKTLHNHNLT